MRIVCPTCGVRLNVTEEHAGIVMRCPKCSGLLKAPDLPAFEAHRRASQPTAPTPDPLDSMQPFDSIDSLDDLALDAPPTDHDPFADSATAPPLTPKKRKRDKTPRKSSGAFPKFKIELGMPLFVTLAYLSVSGFLMIVIVALLLGPERGDTTPDMAEKAMAIGVFTGLGSMLLAQHMFRWQAIDDGDSANAALIYFIPFYFLLYAFGQVGRTWKTLGLFFLGLFMVAATGIPFLALRAW